jgi:hypothetical protein
MNVNQKLKPKTFAKKVGSLLILMAGILVIIKISGVAPTFDPIIKNWWPYTFLIGAFLYCFPKIITNLKKLRLNTVSW